ncbi:MAG: bifunctional riboflavin kinase/FAD synthetase [Sedimentisphaerales bacterium]|jgi:riboflavin kinase/FMN adenylyltransferase
MKVLKTVSELGQLPDGCVLTIGNFDGVHTGHQQNIKVARDIATLEHTSLAVMTFEPHPVAILHPEKAPGVLTPLPLKIHLLENCGVDYLIILRDTTSLLRLLPTDFVDKFLLKDVRPKVLVEGDDFNFGANRAGNIDTLKQMAEPDGFSVVVVPSKLVKLHTGQSLRVSSTTIRYMLQSGHVADAAFLFGRHYRLIGKITPGRGKGRQLGFPTLNMQIPSQIIPQEGVYAGFSLIGDSEEDVCRSDNRLPSVFSIGQAITFGDQHSQLIEAHVLDTNLGDTSGKWLAMDFVDRIRPQRRFESPEVLAAQIARDCDSAKQILSAEKKR